MCGAFSHQFADATLHPMVWYFCGNPQRANNKMIGHPIYYHRIFETALDKYIKRNYLPPFNAKVKTLLKYCKKNGLIKKTNLFELSKAFYSQKGISQKELNKIFRSHAAFQALFERLSFQRC